MDEIEITNGFPQNSQGTSNNPPTLKRKRNLPGNPGMLICSFIACFFYKQILVY